MLAVDCVVSRAVSELVTRDLMTGTEDVLNVIRLVLIKIVYLHRCLLQFILCQTEMIYDMQTRLTQTDAKYRS